MYNLTQFPVRRLSGRPSDRLHEFDIRVQKGFAQHPFPTIPVAPKIMTFIEGLTDTRVGTATLRS